jgi:hypothetical protein
MLADASRSLSIGIARRAEPLKTVIFAAERRRR